MSGHSKAKKGRRSHSIAHRAKYMDDLISEVQTLSNMIKNPAVPIEVLSSDTSESSDDNGDGQEIRMLSTKVNTTNWLVNVFNHEMLINNRQLNLGELYFVRFSKLKPQQKANFDSTVSPACNNGFVMCQLLEISSDECIVKCASTKDENLNFTTITVKREDLAMKSAPTEYYFPAGTRVVAKSTPSTLHHGISPHFFSGTVAVPPLQQSRFDYLIFFDNGHDRYVDVKDVCVMLEQPLDPFTHQFSERLAYKMVERCNPFRAKFLYRYLASYPEWPLLRLKKSENTQRVLVMRNGLRESAFVLDVDRQLALLRFPHPKPNHPGFGCVTINCEFKEHEHIDDWIYRGNSDIFITLQQSNLANPQPIHNVMASQGSQQSSSGFVNESRIARRGHAAQFEMALPLNSQENTFTYSSPKIRENLQTARKSSDSRKIDNLAAQICTRSTSEKVIEDRRIKSQEVKFTNLQVPKWQTTYKKHKTCSPRCLKKVPSSVVKMADYKTRSPYFTPLLYGWTRKLFKLEEKSSKLKSQNFIGYVTPCGVHFFQLKSIQIYLQKTKQEILTIDMFTFDMEIRPEVLAGAPSPDVVICEDFSQKMEDVPISVVNAVDKAQMPSMVYRARRMADVDDENIEVSIGQNFCTGCSCTDDCLDKTKCECQQLTIAENKRLASSLQIKADKVGYNLRELKSSHMTGVYECNSNCSCRQNCINRVAQNNPKIPLQLFMTAGKGWGVRTLVDIPTNTFVCTYSGEILRDSVAEVEGKKKEGDIYFADLNLIDLVENEKISQGIDFIDHDYDMGEDEDDKEKEYDSDDQGIELMSGIGEELLDVSDKRRQKESLQRMIEDAQLSNDKPGSSRSSPASNNSDPPVPRKKEWGTEDFVSYFGDYNLFVMNAAKTGNIGRFLNHSCEPNTRIQQCMVDTHDLRLPWLAFFTTERVKAGTELCWDYAYEIESVAGRRIDCKCGTKKCRGRLL